MPRDVFRLGEIPRPIIGVLFCLAAAFVGVIWVIPLRTKYSTTNMAPAIVSPQPHRTFQIAEGKYWVDTDGSVSTSRNAVLAMIPSSGQPAPNPALSLPALPASSLLIPSGIGPISISGDIQAGFPDIASASMHPSQAAGLVPMPFFLSNQIPANNLPQQVKALNDAIRTEQARQFVMSACADLQGNLWVGTEDTGIERFTPDPDHSGRGQWTRFTSKDGLGDDNGYAVACDHRGRIWVGHLNHGVCVFNGQKWQNYEVIAGLLRPDSLSGPLGERVFHITVCPTDGDVWIATSAGITRYSDSRDAWTYYTRADGLPSDQANSIAFDGDGNVYVATQCDGIALAKSADGYRHWRQVTGPEVAPPQPFGSGLPTNLINDVMVVPDGTVYAATTTGLAWSGDGGKTWNFARGADWADKVRQSAEGPPPGWSEQPGAALAEDYTTCLWQDTASRLYMGHRRRGAETFTLQNGRLITRTLSDGAYVTAGATLPGGIVATGTFGTGVAIATPSAAEPAQPIASSSSTPPLPSGAPPPDLETLNHELAAMADVPPLHPNSPMVLPMDDDWLTEGDWLGRYGRFWCVLAAMDDPIRGYFWGAGPVTIPFNVGLGSNHRPNDFLRFWIGLFFTNNRRALEIPPRLHG